MKAGLTLVISKDKNEIKNQIAELEWQLAYLDLPWTAKEQKICEESLDLLRQELAKMEGK